MRRVGLDHGRALDAVPVEGDRDHGRRRIDPGDALHLLQGFARKSVADVCAAGARHRAACCRLIEAGVSHVLGGQH